MQVEKNAEPSYNYVCIFIHTYVHTYNHHHLPACCSNQCNLCNNGLHAAIVLCCSGHHLGGAWWWLSLIASCCFILILDQCCTGTHLCTLTSAACTCIVNLCVTFVCMHACMCVSLLLHARLAYGSLRIVDEENNCQCSMTK